MRIERINENSIRCTLTSFDLSVRNLNLRELAYGSEKARKLFDEMMAKAGAEVGFHADNTPIMIEAIPMSSDSIQLIISKVTDPEELDTRFSRFTQGHGIRKEAEDWISRLTSALLEGAGGLAGQLQKPEENKGAGSAVEKDHKESETPGDDKEAADIAEFRAFAFEDLDMVISAAKASSFFDGSSTLYKSPRDQHYVLLIRSEGSSGEEFSKACNIVAEYGRMLRTVINTPAYYDEHYKVIAKDSAIRRLAGI